MKYYSFKINSKVRDLIKRLEIKFKCLGPSENEELEKFIYKNNNYEINEEMISFFIKKYSNDIDETIPIASYSNILNFEDDSMYNYINDNIDNYIMNVFLQSNEMQEEKENIEFLLNNLDISAENRNNIVISKNFLIDKLENIEDVFIIELLVKEFKCKPTWNNIIHYLALKKYVIDDILLNYIQYETNYKALSENVIDKVVLIDSDLLDKIYLLFVNENRITVESYTYLMKGVNTKYEAITLDNLDEDKIFILINYKIISLTIENLVNLYPKRKSVATQHPLKMYQ